MTFLARLLVLALLCLAPAAHAASPFLDPARNWVVLVGIDDYEDPSLPPLQFARSDVQSMRAQLLSLGFRADRILTLTNEDATRAEILRLLGDELPDRMRTDDSLLVYWSGHGLTETLPDGSQQGYLIPHDGEADALFSTAVPMSILRDLSDRLPARHILYLVDACYSGLAVPGYRAQIDRPTGTGYDLLEKYGRLASRQVITAGQAGERALEMEGHGLFTRCLLQALNGEADTNVDGLITTSELATWLRVRVTERSGRVQTPQFARWYGEGEYVLVVGEVSRAPSAPAAVGRPRGEATPEPVVSRSTAELKARRAGGTAMAAGGLMLASGAALYVSGKQQCEELGSTACNEQMSGAMRGTVALWGGGVLGLSVGLGLQFGAGRTEVGLTAARPLAELERDGFR